MKYIGFLLYIIYRILAKISNKIIGFCLESYLKLATKSCGNKIQVSGFGRFMCVSNLELGENVGINFGAYWVCEGGLKIGDNCRFAKNVTIYTRNHNYNSSKLPYDNTNVLKPVIIGKNVWVGTNVTILPGTVINDGAIIGAGSVVFGEIPMLAIVGSGGKKVIGQRNEKSYFELEKNEQYHQL